MQNWWWIRLSDDTGGNGDHGDGNEMEAAKITIIRTNDGVEKGNNGKNN